MAWYHRLPGPGALRAAIVVVLVTAALAVVLFGYEWLGRAFLDTGGRMG